MNTVRSEAYEPIEALGGDVESAQKTIDISEVMANVQAVQALVREPEVIAGVMGLEHPDDYSSYGRMAAHAIERGLPSTSGYPECHWHDVKKSLGHPEAKNREELTRLVAIDGAIRNGIKPDRLHTRSTEQIQRLAHHAFKCVYRGIPITTPKAEVTRMVNEGIYPNAT